MSNRFEKMNKKMLMLGMIILLLTVGLSGCIDNYSNNGKNNFVGTWELLETSDSDIWTFYSNNTVKNIQIQDFEGETLTSTSWFDYEISENKLHLMSHDISQDSPSYYSEYFDYEFSDNNSLLTLSVGGTTALILSKI